MPANPGVYNGGAPIRGLVSLPATTEMLTVDASGNMSRQSIPTSSDKLPLSGGTLTGNLNGTTAAFNGLLTGQRVASSSGYTYGSPQFYSSAIGSGAGFQIVSAGSVALYGNTVAVFSANDDTNGIRIDGSRPLGFVNGHALSNSPDVTIRRNSTGPSLETRSPGGLKVCNADGSATGPLNCAAISAVSLTLPNGNYYAPSLIVGNFSKYDNGGLETVVGGSIISKLTSTRHVLRNSTVLGWATSGADASTDIDLQRNSSAQLDIRADNGLRLRNLANSGWSDFQSGAITANSSITGTQSITSATYTYGQPQFRNSNYGIGSGFQIVTAAATAIYGNGNAIVSFNDTTNGILIDGSRPLGWVNGHALANVADVSIRRNATGPTLETRSAAGLRVRNSDGSAFASVQGRLTTETNYTAGAPTPTGYIVLYDAVGTAYKVPAEAL